MIERAEFPVHRNSTLKGRFSGDRIVDYPYFYASRTLAGLQPHALVGRNVQQIADLRMTVAAVVHKKADQ